MSAKLIGYLTQSGGKSNHVSLNIAVFEKERQAYIQHIDPITHNVIKLTEVQARNLILYEDNRLYNVGLNQPAIFLISFNNDVHVGSKVEIDRIILELIQQQQLSQMNLFSLYTFLGIPQKIAEAAHSIIQQYPALRLSIDNFVLPKTSSIAAEKTPPALFAVMDRYANILYSSRLIGYGDLVQYVDLSEDNPVYEVSVGLCSFNWDDLQSALPFLLHPDPPHASAIRVNDFTITLLIGGKKQLPPDVRLCQYVPDDFMQDPDLMGAGMDDDLFSLQRRSSSNYYRYQPTAKTALQSAAMISRRVGLEIGKAESIVTEISFAESEEFDAIQQHIVQTHQVSNE